MRWSILSERYANKTSNSEIQYQSERHSDNGERTAMIKSEPESTEFDAKSLAQNIKDHCGAAECKIYFSTIESNDRYLVISSAQKSKATEVRISSNSGIHQISDPVNLTLDSVHSRERAAKLVPPPILDPTEIETKNLTVAPIKSGTQNVGFITTVNASDNKLTDNQIHLARLLIENYVAEAALVSLSMNPDFSKSFKEFSVDCLQVVNRAFFSKRSALFTLKNSPSEFTCVSTFPDDLEPEKIGKISLDEISRMNPIAETGAVLSSHPANFVELQLNPNIARVTAFDASTEDTRSYIFTFSSGKAFSSTIDSRIAHAARVVVGQFFKYYAAHHARSVELEAITKHQTISTALDVARSYKHSAINDLSAIELASVALEGKVEKKKKNIMDEFWLFKELVDRKIKDANKNLKKITDMRKIDEKVSDVDLGKSWGSAVDRSFGRLEAAKVETRNPGNEVVLRLRRSQVEHILVNLIMNSVEAFRNKPKKKNRWIGLEMHEILGIGGTTKGKGVRLVYEDSAGGIRTDKLRDGEGDKVKDITSVFDAEVTSKTGEDGAGYGMYLVQYYAGKHQGNVSVENTSDGTKFVITLFDQGRKSG